MLTEITNMEYMVVKCHSIIRKLFPNQEEFEPKVSFSAHFFQIIIIEHSCGWKFWGNIIH